MFDHKEFLKPLLSISGVTGVVHTREYMPSTPRMLKEGEDEIYLTENYSVYFSTRRSEVVTKLIETLNDMNIHWTLADENTINFVRLSSEW